MVFRTPQLVAAVNNLLGLVESVDVKLDKLLASDFNAGIRHLQELRACVGEQSFLLRQAWERFAVAITHEEGERRCLAYLGLSFCQHSLGEEEIARNTLKELVAYDWKDHRGRVAVKINKVREWLNIEMSYLSTKEGRQLVREYLDSLETQTNREARISSLKEQARAFLREGRSGIG